ncbi:MAG: site-specific integrase [Symbiopectobacterium sp.]
MNGYEQPPALLSPLLTSIVAFLRYLKAERQFSPLTQENYCRQLGAIAAMLDEMGLTDWHTLDAARVRSVAARRKRGGLQAASLALRLSALRSFLDWQMAARGINCQSCARYFCAQSGSTSAEKHGCG